MASSRQPSGSDAGPRKEIHDAYQRCLRARGVWAGFSASLRSPNVKRPGEMTRDEAHSVLHGTTMMYFETAQPYLAGAAAGSRAKDYWENAPIYPAREATQPGVRCPSGHAYEEAEAAGTPCPECGEELAAASVLKTASDGTPVMVWRTGLRQLQTFVDETREVEVDAGEWSVGTETKEVPMRMDPDVLLRAGRYLDEALGSLGLLASVDEDRPLAEV